MWNVLMQVAELHQHAAAAFLLQPVAGIDLDDHAVDLARLQRRHLRRRGAERGDGDAVRRPSPAGATAPAPASR